MRFVDICDLEAVEKPQLPEHKPGCILIETISNPLLRVGQLDRIAEIARGAWRGAGGGQYLRDAAVAPSARTGRALQRAS